MPPKTLGAPELKLWEDVMKPRESEHTERRDFWRPKRVALTLAVAGLATLTAAACQTDAKPTVTAQAKPQVQRVIVEKPRCELRNFSKARAFLTEAWAIPDNRFFVGEPFRLQIRVSTQSYMSIFHVSTSCKVTRLMDNRPIVAATIVDFPTKDSGLNITVKPPPGPEAFYFIASRQKIDVLAASDILRGDEIASLDLSPKQFFDRLEQVIGRINPADLGLTTLGTAVVGN